MGREMEWRATEKADGEEAHSAMDCERGGGGERELALGLALALGEWSHERAREGRRGGPEEGQGWTESDIWYHH